MKGRSYVLLLALIRSSTCLVLYSYGPHTHQPNFVCPSFPFCYQDHQTGGWKSLLENRVSTNSLQRDVAIESSECWSSGYYCRSDASNLIKHLELDTPEDCQVKCQEESGCENFSFHDTRGQGRCSLLKNCLVKTECLAESNCATGRKTCDCPALEYLPGNKDSSEFARWKCGNVDPYAATIPVGTVCSTTCPSWKDSTLQSTCLLNGKWSPTKPGSNPTRTLGYAAPYPTPDQPDMVCGCQDVGPFTYDPNTEEGAAFVCQGWGPEQYKKAGGWTIKNTDHCDLYCSNEPKPIVSVYCEGAKWKGEPELGFWCYDKPEKPDPQKQKPKGTCEGDFCWKGPSRRIDESKGKVTGYGFPEYYNSVEECAKKCEEVADCEAFVYYDRPDPDNQECYMYKGGIISPPLDDGRQRLAGVSGQGGY